jgi:glutamyl-tRNA synthetase
MNGDVSGVAEPGLLGYTADDVVQFERIGFARLDQVADEPDSESVAYFTHP